MNAHLTGLILAVSLGLGAQSAMAETKPEPQPFACFDPVPPVTELAIPSRYKDGSKNRSDFDTEANAAVEAALNPVDDFINTLVKMPTQRCKSPQRPRLTQAPLLIPPPKSRPIWPSKP